MNTGFACMFAWCHGGQRRVLDALKLELQTVKSKGLTNIKLGGNWQKERQKMGD